MARRISVVAVSVCLTATAVFSPSVLAQAPRVGLIVTEEMLEVIGASSAAKRFLQEAAKDSYLADLVIKTLGISAKPTELATSQELALISSRRLGAALVNNDKLAEKFSSSLSTWNHDSLQSTQYLAVANTIRANEFGGIVSSRDLTPHHFLLSPERKGADLLGETFVEPKAEPLDPGSKPLRSIDLKGTTVTFDPPFVLCHTSSCQLRVSEFGVGKPISFMAGAAVAKCVDVQCQERLLKFIRSVTQTPVGTDSGAATQPSAKPVQ